MSPQISQTGLCNPSTGAVRTTGGGHLWCSVCSPHASALPMLLSANNHQCVIPLFHNLFYLPFPRCAISLIMAALSSGWCRQFFTTRWNVSRSLLSHSSLIGSRRWKVRALRATSITSDCLSKPKHFSASRLLLGDLFSRLNCTFAHHRTHNIKNKAISASLFLPVEMAFLARPYSRKERPCTRPGDSRCPK